MRPKPYRVPEHWIETYLEPRYPDLATPFRRAADATATALRDGELDDDTFAGLVRLLDHRSTVLRDSVGDLVGRLAAEFPAAMDVVVHRTRSPLARTRREALTWLRHSPPSPTHERVCAAGLLDRSAVVRAQAADNVRYHGLEALAPVLTEAAGREDDPATRRTMERALASVVVPRG
ncbi:hypothetical protein GCM10025875_05460 [Litorihabitans aurantiacus]|uniref:HEAT repeat domain-containing protein n=1 Tax=Litorihabitans aurantiacus TaxID=1930061 RepID=A0AA37XB13_9MICO|nr:hypothetical protein GCM10025875_05460 [Litorihabitans aurantiacus]